MKIPSSRGKTERPHEPSLQLGSEARDNLRRIGRRLRSRDSGLDGANVEILPWLFWASNLDPYTGPGTLPGGQFDWGGRLLKSNGGVRRCPQADWKPAVECNGIRALDCETDRSSRCESRS